MESGITETGITKSGITWKFDSGIRDNKKLESGIRLGWQSVCVSRYFRYDSFEKNPKILSFFGLDLD